MQKEGGGQCNSRTITIKMALAHIKYILYPEQFFNGARIFKRRRYKQCQSIMVFIEALQNL